MKNKKKMKKLFIIIGASILAVIIIVIGIILLRNNNTSIFVQTVEDLNNTWAISDQTYSGMIVESAQQRIFLEPGQSVNKVFVKEGDKVNKGDKLFKYDTELLELDVEEKQLSVDICKNSLTLAENKLEEYKEIVPVAEAPTQAEPETDLDSEEPEDISPEENDNESNNSETQPIEPEEPDSDENEEEGEYSDEPTYTAAEKSKLVRDQELEVKKLENALGLAENSLDAAKKALEDATVYANMNGIVKSIGKANDSASDGSAFCELIGNDGVTLEGYLTEFDLDSTNIGDKLTVTSWMSGSESEAEITAIDDYPAENAYGYSNGNQNTSYYKFTAFIENADGFEIGEDVEIRKQTENTQGLVVIENIYIRTDNDGSYAMIDDGSGRLTRTDVTVEKTSDPQYVKVTSGLSLSDQIAFPYGDGVKEGAKTTTEYHYSLF